MRSDYTQRGDMLIMSLLMLVAFVVIVAAWAQFAARQSHSVTDQEQEEEAFEVAEAGIQYVLFLLNSGAFTPDTLVAGGQIVQPVIDPVSVQDVGHYELAFAGGGSAVAMVSVGYAINNPERCQEIYALVDSFSGAVGGTQYYVRSFDHEIDITGCGSPPIPPSPPATPLPSPSPSPPATPSPWPSGEPWPWPGMVLFYDPFIEVSDAELSCHGPVIPNIPVGWIGGGGGVCSTPAPSSSPSPSPSPSP